MKFVSERHPDLRIPTIGVQFHGGVAEVTKLGAIAHLLSPWMRGRGVHPAIETEPCGNGHSDKVVVVGVEDEEPPRAGRGSSRSAWAAYADRIGVRYPPEAKQRQIIAAVDAAKQAV